MSTFGFSWSWRRAIGLSALKGHIARLTGIPTTRSGAERKIGRGILNLFLPRSARRLRRRW